MSRDPDLDQIRKVTWRLTDDPKLLAGANAVPFLQRRSGPPGHRIEWLDQSDALGTPLTRKP